MIVVVVVVIAASALLGAFLGAAVALLRPTEDERIGVQEAIEDRRRPA